MRALEVLGISMLTLDLAVGGITLLLSNPFRFSWITLLQAMLVIFLVGTVMLLADWARRPRRAVKRSHQTGGAPGKRLCMYCGARNPGEAFYCPSCGKKLLHTA